MILSPLCCSFNVSVSFNPLTFSVLTGVLRVCVLVDTALSLYCIYSVAWTVFVCFMHLIIVVCFYRTSDEQEESPTLDVIFST
jgi:hypothetical protein